MPDHARAIALDEIREVALPDSAFVGRSMLRFVTKALRTEAVSVNVMDFAADARTRPHCHDSDQLIVYLSGEGIVAVDGGADELVPAGVFVVLPADSPHMHGAGAAGPARHISIMPTGHSTDFDCVISAGWDHWRP